MADWSGLNVMAFTFTVDADYPPINILDPVPDLTDKGILALQGKPVTAIAADSAAPVVLRIPVNYVNERLTLTLVRDPSSTSADQDGKIAALQFPGGRKAC